jgi:hypothetical protein
MKTSNFICILSAAILLPACTSKRLEEENQVLREKLAEVEASNAELSTELAETALRYEKLCADIVESLKATYLILYKDIDHKKERERSIRNYEAMKMLFLPLVQNLNSPDDTGPAFQALQETSRSKVLSGFSAIAYGVAAAEGHQPSLQALLNHEELGILLSSTVLALEKTALNGNTQAQDFLIGVIESGSSTALWSAAAKGLESAAAEGNPRAKAAIQKYAEFEAARKSRSANP